MGHKHEHGHERKHRHERSEKSRKRTRKWLLFALLLVVILAAWLICCNKNIKDAWDVLSGGGASDNKTETNGKIQDEENETPTPTVASTPNTDVTPTEALKGAETGDTIVITVDCKKVTVSGKGIQKDPFICEDSGALQRCLAALMSLPVKDSTSVILQDATGDYNVSEQIRKILLEQGWEYTESVQ